MSTAAPGPAAAAARKPIVIGGKLKFKGSSSTTSKKRKPEDASAGQGTAAATEAPPMDKATASAPDGASKAMTETQRKHMEKKMKLDLQQVKTNTTTYRDRVEQFNQRLATTTEHNDIPRISAAGNG